MATSVQDLSRPGEEVDLYYYDGETAKKQAFPTTINTKYVQQFANLTGGSSVFTIPPNNGLSDIVCEFVMPALSSLSVAQRASVELPRAWGYALIKQVSFRYGGSSQYFLTGDQIFQNALRAQTSRTSATDIAVLGGNYATAADLAVAQYANIVLTLPHNIPSGVGKAHPLPSDLLTQQVQITVELNPIASVFGISSTPEAGTKAALQAALLTGLSSAQFQVAQIMFNNQGDSLARRVDMSTNAYAYPCEFVQQIQRIPLAAGAGSQSVVLTGFRSGEVKAIHCWLSRGVDLSGLPLDGVANPFNWQLPLAVQMTYAGDVYARFENKSSPLWNLINGNKAPAFENNVAVDAGATFTSASAISQWVELPFAQPLVDEDSHYTLVHGRPITNGIVNLQITPPESRADWVLNVSYIYNATLLFSQGTCDYIF